MSPDDPRHGTYAGYSAHWKSDRKPCKPCREAGSRVRKRNVWAKHTGRPATVPAIGSIRRVGALMALGYNQERIAAEAGLPVGTLRNVITRDTSVYATTAEAIKQTYDRLSMTLPPSDTPQQRRSARYARTVAKKRGYAPPLAWEDVDIDDPAARPCRSRRTHEQPVGGLDHAAIQRRLNGDRTVRLGAGESAEVVRRALARGMTWPQIEHQLGINTHRYATQEGTAT